MAETMNIAEEEFYDFLNDFELSSMVKGLKTQVWVKFGNNRRRVDFVITLLNNKIFYIETDGKMHEEYEVKKLDRAKDYHAEEFGIPTLRIKFSDFYQNKEMIANKIEGMIELLNGD
jgi:very-short-patch-repair endonuclease